MTTKQAESAACKDLLVGKLVTSWARIERVVGLLVRNTGRLVERRGGVEVKIIWMVVQADTGAKGSDILQTTRKCNH